VHTPLQAKPDLVEQYRQRLRPGMRHTNATYAAMMHSLDESLGRLLQKLEELKIADRTVVIFTGDNGGLIGNGVTNNAPLRAGKGTAYEGGTRVPLIVRWPGVVPKQSVCSTPVISIDYLPTILEIAGVPIPPQSRSQVDGVSIVRLLKDPSATLGRDAIYWHYPHYHSEGATPYGAIRSGDWKLIEFYEDRPTELYDLAADVGERNNLAGKLPQKAAELRGRLDTWRKSVGAQLPTPNPDRDPEKDAAQLRPAKKKSAAKPKK
jgi:arylsulfatase A-like enzyme